MEFWPLLQPLASSTLYHIPLPFSSCGLKNSHLPFPVCQISSLLLSLLCTFDIHSFTSKFSSLAYFQLPLEHQLFSTPYHFSFLNPFLSPDIYFDFNCCFLLPLSLGLHRSLSLWLLLGFLFTYPFTQTLFLSLYLFTSLPSDRIKTERKQQKKDTD